MIETTLSTTKSAIDRLIDVTRDKGGASVSITGKGLPEFGFMVGGIVDSLIMGQDLLEPSHYDLLYKRIHEYVKDNSAFLADDRTFLGGWIDQAEGILYIDISEVFYVKEWAEVVANDRDEIAIWDLAKGEEIRVRAAEAH